MTMLLAVVRAAGTPHEIGRAYGRAAARAVVANLDRYLARFAQVGLDRDTVRAQGERFGATTRRRLPRVAAMVEGVAAAVDRPAAELYALNARTELLFGATRDGCTAVGLSGERRPGVGAGALLAQNWDWSPAQAESMLLLETRDERGHATLGLVEAGMLAKAGLNSAGIGVCVNVMASARDGEPGGVPYHLILRAILESTTFAGAALAAAGLPRSASLNVLVGAATGELVDLELAPGAVDWTWPHDGALAHANHFEACAGIEDRLLALAPLAASSRARADRARALLASASDADDLAAILRDHGGPHPICVHHDPSDPPERRTETLASLLLDLEARRLSIAVGPPCRAPYQALALGSSPSDANARSTLPVMRATSVP